MPDWHSPHQDGWRLFSLVRINYLNKVLES